MIRAISLLGSTGSIGRQTLEVCEETGVKVEALTARSNVDLLEEQVRRFHPRLAVLGELDAARALKSRLADVDVEVAYGLDGLLRAAALPESDAVVTAVVGIAGLRPTLAAIEKGVNTSIGAQSTTQRISGTPIAATKSLDFIRKPSLGILSAADPGGPGH